MTSQKWSQKKLSEIVERLNAGVSVNSSDTPPLNEAHAILKTSAVTRGKFNPLKSKIIAFNKKK